MGEWKLWEPAPAGPVPVRPGGLRHTDGTPLHGVWGLDGETGESVVVANHGHVLLGWLVPRHRWQVASELLRASTCALAQVPWVWSRQGQVVASDPSDVAVGLVLAGRKPAALADSDDEAVARRWVDRARRQDLVARIRSSTYDCGAAPVTHWFVEMAVAGTVEEHVDVDVLLSDYAACLPAPAFTEVEAALTELRRERFADLIADRGLIFTTRPGEYARAGLVLGYHPATTAALILGRPTTSWAADEEAAFVVTLLAAAATAVGLPDLPSALLTEVEAVR